MTQRPVVIEIVVADMAASLAFYRRLGVDIPAEADTEPHVDVALDTRVRLAFDTVATIQSFDPDYVAPTRSRVALAFGCDTPAEVDDLYASLTAAGYEGHRAPWDAFWGMRYAVVHDPDGVGVDLFALLPATTG